MLKGLIENECGGQNSLIKLTSHFTNASDQKLTQESIKSLRSFEHQQQFTNPADQLVSEYLAIESQKNKLNQQAAAAAQHQNANNMLLRRLPAPRSFNMEALFNELKQMDTLNTKVAAASTSSLDSTSLGATQNTAIANNQLARSVSPNLKDAAQDWSQEYWSSLSAAFHKQSPLIIDDRAFKWSADYLTQTESTIFDEAWESLLMKNTNQLANGVNAGATNLLSLGINNNAENMLATNQLNDEMRKTANDLLDSMQDSPFSETEFMQFVRNLSANGLNTNDASAQQTNDKKLIDEYLNNEQENAQFNLLDNDLASEWVKEFQTLGSKESEKEQGSYWNELQDEWNSVASTNPNHPWLDDFQKVFDTYKVYEFDKENPLRQHPNPFEEGLERLKVHDIVNAVLLFEVAVQKDPANMLAWQYLGTTQVENEQDPQAIRALRRCLELKPDNLIALSTLATSYTNESMQRLAFDSLIKWIKHHSDYAHLLKDDEQASRLLTESELLNAQQTTPFYMATLSVVHARDFIDLQEVFLKAVRESSLKPQKIDPDLQCCLGVLFHLSGEYDKAADCFKTALQIKPNDHLLWNKLGATYANNNRNEEAIDAYYQALKLCPGFVRARYNLGIGCMNLGAYKEAVEHFLTALIQQSQANLNNDKTSKTKLNNLNNIQQMSETIWSTLRLALSYLDRSDLYQYCLSKDLEYLKSEFKI